MITNGVISNSKLAVNCLSLNNFPTTVLDSINDRVYCVKKNS